MSNQDAKIPYVRFVNQPREDREASLEAGFVVMKDVPVVSITPPGSKDTVVRDVAEWLQQNKDQVNEGRMDPAWADAYTRAYKSWVETGDVPTEGTHIKNWPLLTPAQVETLTGLKLLTVEGLASAPEDVIGRMGMGGRGLKDKAQKWLDTQNNGGGKLAQDNEALRLKNEYMEKVIQEQGDALRNLEAQVKAMSQAPAAAAPTGNITKL